MSEASTCQCGHCGDRTPPWILCLYCQAVFAGHEPPEAHECTAAEPIWMRMVGQYPVSSSPPPPWLPWPAHMFWRATT